MNDEHIKVSEAKKRYLSGTMSIRWWYRQIEEGKLRHVRAGASVRLRVLDVEAFIAEMFRERAAPVQKTPEPASDPEPVPAPISKRSRRGGLRFFN